MKALSPRPRKAKLKKPAQKTEEKFTCFAENRKFTLFPSGLVNVSFWRHTSTLVYVRQLFAYSKGLEYRRDLFVMAVVTRPKLNRSTEFKV